MDRTKTTAYTLKGKGSSRGSSLGETGFIPVAVLKENRRLSFNSVYDDVVKAEIRVNRRRVGGGNSKTVTGAVDDVII